MRYLLMKLLPVLLSCASVAYAEFNVRAFGAKGDKEAPDTTAFQAAIDAAHDAGGGTVRVPAGEYLSGGLVLRSRVTLHLEAGAVLYASTRKDDYPGASRGRLLSADGAEHIAVVGHGVIHGQATGDLGRRPGTEDAMPAFRTGIIQFTHCTNVAIRGITILYSDAWTVHLKQCDTVYIDGVTIRNNYFRTNSDGIDPDSCRNVHISNCHITAGDDCIVLKSTVPVPCENIVVVNCTLESIATALKLGTESHGDFRNIHFSNIVIRNSRTGIGLYVKDGATIERVTFENISIETADPEEVAYVRNMATPIFIDVEKRHEDSPLGKVRDISFSNIQIRSGSGVLIQAPPESPIESLSIRNLTLRVYNPMDYSERRKVVGGTRTLSDQRDTEYARQPSYLTLANVHGFTIDTVRVLMSKEAFAVYPRAALSGHQIVSGVIANVAREPSQAAVDTPVIRLENAQRVLVTDGIPSADAPYLTVAGPHTSEVVARTNGLEGTIQSEPDVPREALKVVE
jgi:hypothetical protein